MTKKNVRMLGLIAPILITLFLLTQPAAAQTPQQTPNFPSETPEKFTPTNADFDYERRVVMIAMRDGVKLHTVILVPKGAKGAPILLTRTPYDADGLTSHAESSHLGSILYGYDNATDVIVEGGYIRVIQDVRGKHGSEGDYVMNRPLLGTQNPTAVDHSTDTYDTIDWLVKNIPESNGKVGILGISYDGFLPLMALVNPHPALKAAVPMNPMVDGWMGDDWFHNGAFRQQMMDYIYDQEATRDNKLKWWTSHYDEYDMFMQAGSDLEREHAGVRQGRRVPHVLGAAEVAMLVEQRHAESRLARHGAARGSEGAGNHFEQRCLAGSVAAHHAPALTLRDGEGDVRENGGGAELDGDVGQGQQRHSR